MIDVTNSADGLASAYQITEVTAGGPPVLETGGNLLIGVITLPHSEPLPLTTAAPLESSVTQSEGEREILHNRLALEMTENRLFRRLVEQGVADLELARMARDSERQKLELSLAKEFEEAEAEAQRISDSER